MAKRFKKTLNLTQYSQITLLFMLMALAFRGKLSEDMIGMITKLKMPVFAALISYQNDLELNSR